MFQLFIKYFKKTQNSRFVIMSFKIISAKQFFFKVISRLLSTIFQSLHNFISFKQFGTLYLLIEYFS